MNGVRHDDVEVRLERLEQLFEDPGQQPFDPSTRFERGIDEVIERLGDPEHRDARRVVVLLPAEQIDDQTAPRATAAIERYCAYRSSRRRRDLRTTRDRGLRGLRVGLVVLAVALGLSTLVDEADWLPDFLQRFFSEGIIITGG